MAHLAINIFRPGVLFQKKLFCIHGSHFLMADTMKGQSQGLSASLSGRNFRSCSQAVTKTCCFFLVSGAGRVGVRGPTLRTYGTFFKASRRGCSACEKNGASIPIQQRHMDGGAGGEDGQCKAMARDERVHVCAREKEREGETALKAVGLTYSLPAATLSVVLPITPVQ